MLLRLGHHGEIESQMALHAGQLLRHHLIVMRRGGGDETPATDGVTVDPFRGDEGQRALQGGIEIAIDGEGIVGAMAGRQRVEGFLQGSAEISGIAPRGAEARILLVEDGDAASRPQQGQSGPKPRVSRADDGHVAGRGQRRPDRQGRCRIPPIGRVAKIRREDAVHRHCQTALGQTALAAAGARGARPISSRASAALATSSPRSSMICTARSTRAALLGASLPRER